MKASCSASVLLVVEQLRRKVPGGAGTYAMGLLTGLGRMADSGEQVPPVALLASRPRPGDDRHSDSIAHSDPIAESYLPLIESRLPGPLMTRAWDTGLLRAPRGFAVVHAASLAAPHTASVAKPHAATATTVVTVHDLAWRHVPFAYPKRGREWHERAFSRALAFGCDIVVPSEPIADEVRGAGADATRVTVIEPGVDHMPDPDFTAADNLLGRLGVQGRFMLSVGTLEPRKNLDRLMAAYSDVRNSLPGPWPLVVVGPEGWGPGLEPRDGVQFAGHVKPAVLSALYAKAELLAYVPLVEGFGLPPLEAMWAGTPVVASEVPSVGGAAFLVNPRDRGEIAEGLLTVSTDRSVRDGLVKAGMTRAAELTWKENASHHVKLWRDIMQREGHG